MSSTRTTVTILSSCLRTWSSTLSSPLTTNVMRDRFCVLGLADGEAVDVEPAGVRASRRRSPGRPVGSAPARKARAASEARPHVGGNAVMIEARTPKGERTAERRHPDAGVRSPAPEGRPTAARGEARFERNPWKGAGRIAEAPGGATETFAVRSVAPPGLQLYFASVPGVALTSFAHPWLPSVAPPGLKARRPPPPAYFFRSCTMTRTPFLFDTIDVEQAVAVDVGHLELRADAAVVVDQASG